MAEESEHPYSSKRPAILARARRAKDPAKFREYHRRYHYKLKYGIPYEEVEALKAEQKVCAICGTVPTKWAVDHDHTTGKFRGLLCSRCNLAIGSLGDTADSLMRAVDYLRRAATGNNTNAR